MQRHDLPKIIVIVGPTSSGKTALSVELAKKFDGLPPARAGGARAGEIISADSRQVYRGLDIGTGKVTKREMQGIPHHLLDVASPKKVFTASDFVIHARRAINDIIARGHVPIIAGGTGFYIDALIGTTVLADVPPNAVLRAKLQKKSAEQLFAQLKKLDPARASMIDAHNPHRLIRAIEIATALGKNPSKRSDPLYDVLWLGIDIPHEALARKIHARLLARMKHGMLAEAKRLHARGLSYKRMEGLGLEYRYMARLLQDKITRTEFIDQLDGEIRKYAKRQMTWFKHNKDINWVKSETQAGAIVRRFLRS